MPITVFKPSIRRRDMDAVLSCLVSDQLGPGVMLQSFVGDVAKYLGLSGGSAVREYRRAISIVLRALGVGHGARVAVSVLAPSVYRDALVAAGCEVVLCDVEPDIPVIDPARIEAATTGGIDALVVHTTLGFVPNLAAIAEMGIPFVEDVSHGLGSHTGEKLCGTHGSYTVVGCEPSDVITTGGGAAILGAGRKERATIRAVLDGYTEDIIMPDMNAALGVTQIKEIEKFIARRKEIAGVFSRAVMASRHRVPVQHGEAENVFFAFPVLVESAVPEAQLYARKKNVTTVPAFAGSIYARMLEDADAPSDGGLETDGETTEVAPLDPAAFPNARRFFMRCILFPLYPSLGRNDVETIQRVLGTLP